MANSNGSQVTRITTGNVRPSQIRWSKKLTDTLYFRDSTGAMRIARVGVVVADGHAQLADDGVG